MGIIYKSAWIHIENRRVLFLQGRGKDMFYIPGGKREENETDQEALIREIKEELSVTLIPETITLQLTIESEAHGQSVPTKLVMKCYTAEHTGDLTVSGEIEKMAWWTTDDKKHASDAGAQILDWLHDRGLIS